MVSWPPNRPTKLYTETIEMLPTYRVLKFALAVFAAAGPTVRYYIWEYDNPPDPVASARIAYRYLTCQR